MLRNRDLKFHCEHVSVRVEQTDTPFTAPRDEGAGPAHPDRARRRQLLRGAARSSSELEAIGPRDLPLRDARGRDRPTPPIPNGALNNIAGICSERRNVVGLMPHPERACEPVLGSADGLVLFESVVSALSSQGAVLRAGRQWLTRTARATAKVILLSAAVPGRDGPWRLGRHAAHAARPRADRLGAGRGRGRRCVARSFPADPIMSPVESSVLERHGLKPDEYDRIVRALGREPSLTELGIFSVMWSEHCSYKSSRIHLRKLPTEGPRVLQGPGENAGAVDIGDGLAAVFKIESHNHPSFIEPYQGAATGVGGIIRDIFTMGARPIALLNSLRFGALDGPERRADAPHRRGRRRRDRRLRQQHRHPDGRRRDRVRRPLRRQSARQRVLPRHRRAPTRSSRAAPPASAIRSTTSARRPAATASTARRWRRRSSTRRPPRSGRPCRSAIRSWRSCCSRRASS